MRSLQSKSLCCLTDNEELLLLSSLMDFLFMFLNKESWERVFQVQSINLHERWSSFHSSSFFLRFFFPKSFLQLDSMIMLIFLFYKWHVTQLKDKKKKRKEKKTKQPILCCLLFSGQGV